MVYRISTPSPLTLIPSTKMRISALSSRMVPPKGTQKLATYRLISVVDGNSARHCLS